MRNEPLERIVLGQQLVTVSDDRRFGLAQAMDVQWDFGPSTKYKPAGNLLRDRIPPATARCARPCAVRRAGLKPVRRRYAGACADYLGTLAKVQADGWGYAENASFIGGRNLSVPVGHAGGRTREVLTIASLRSAHTVDDDLFDLLLQLLQCAETIGRVAGIA